MKIGAVLASRSPRRPRLVPLELPMQSNPGRYGPDGDTRLINCYPEQAGREGKIPMPIYAADGLKSFSSLSGGGACRGMLPTPTRLFAVSGRLLYSVDASGGAAVLGGIPGDGPVFMARNRANPFEVAIAADGLPFVVVNNTLSAITDTDLQPPTNLDFIDGYILYGVRNGRFYYSEIDDASNIGANSYAEAEGNPDGLKRLFVHNRTIFLLGDVSTELWESTGDTTFPFQRSPGAYYEIGCLSPASVVSLGGNVAWITNLGTVIVASIGGGFKRISTHAVERSIDSLTNDQKAKIEGFVYERRGHEFYVLSGATFTWIYDLTTGEWHERMSYGENRWRASYYAHFDGKHIVGDSESAVLNEIDPDTYTEAGEHLVATMRVPINAWPNCINLHRLRVDAIPGVGLNEAALHNSDPQMMLRLSKNGGKSYGNEMTRSIGKIGQYTAQTAFDKLGVSNEDGFVCEISASAAVVRAFTGIASEADILRR